MLPGCKHWSRTVETVNRFPVPRMKPDSVVVEIAVVEIAEEQIPILGSIWPSVDEQAIPIKIRRVLDRNGFRAGILSGQLPTSLLDLLEGQHVDDPASQLLDAELRQRLSHRRTFIEHQRMQLTEGEEHWVACAGPVDQLVWTLALKDQIRSGTCHNARCGFNISIEPLGDSTARLMVTPEVRFGHLRPRYGVVGDLFMYQEEMEKVRLAELALDQTLRPGQTLVVAPAQRMSGLAADFFSKSYSGDFSRRFLLIRILQTQRDDLICTGTGQTTFGEQLELVEVRSAIGISAAIPRVTRQPFIRAFLHVIIGRNPIGSYYANAHNCTSRNPQEKK